MLQTDVFESTTPYALTCLGSQPPWTRFRYSPDPADTLGCFISWFHFLLQCLSSWYGILVAWQMCQFLLSCPWWTEWRTDFLFWSLMCTSSPPPHHWLTISPTFIMHLIYTDNDNTVMIFNTMCCLPWYNSILISAADVLMKGNLHLHDLHIPGEQNYVADAILWNNFNLARQYVPGIAISPFTPPQLMLGAAQNWSHQMSHPDNPTGKSGHESTSSTSALLPSDKPWTTPPGKIMDQPSTHT